MQQRRRKPAEIIKTVVAIILVSGLILSMGTAAFVIGIKEIIGAKASKDWSTITGVVIRSKVKVTRENVSQASRTSKTIYSYQPDVGYKYIVNGKSYIGDRISWGQVTNKDLAEMIVEKYALNKIVNVYYDSNHAEQSVLEPGYSGGLLFLPCLGLAVIACGLFTIFIIWNYGSSLAESLGTTIGNNFFLRMFAFIIGFFLLAGGLLYLMYHYLYGP